MNKKIIIISCIFASVALILILSTVFVVLDEVALGDPPDIREAFAKYDDNSKIVVVNREFNEIRFSDRCIRTAELGCEGSIYDASVVNDKICIVSQAGGKAFFYRCDLKGENMELIHSEELSGSVASIQAYRDCFFIKEDTDRVIIYDMANDAHIETTTIADDDLTLKDFAIGYTYKLLGEEKRELAKIGTENGNLFLRSSEYFVIVKDGQETVLLNKDKLSQTEVGQTLLQYKIHPLDSLVENDKAYLAYCATSNGFAANNRHVVVIEYDLKTDSMEFEALIPMSDPYDDDLTYISSVEALSDNSIFAAKKG